MLSFIKFGDENYAKEEHLNTSHVIFYPKSAIIAACLSADLNTSHVIFYRSQQRNL